MNTAKRERLRRRKVFEFRSAEVFGVALGCSRVGLERADTRCGGEQAGEVDANLREGILLERRNDIAVVVVVRPGPAVIAGPGVVQAADGVCCVTPGAGHCATSDDYVLAAVPLKHTQGAEVAAFGEVHGDKDVPSCLRPKEAAGFVVAGRLFVERNHLPVEFDVNVTVAVGCESLQAGVDDQVAVFVDGAKSVDVGEVVLGGHALGPPVPIGRLLVVLCPA